MSACPILAGAGVVCALRLGHAGRCKPRPLFGSRRAPVTLPGRAASALDLAPSAVGREHAAEVRPEFCDWSDCNLEG